MNLTKEQKEFRQKLLVAAIGNSKVFSYNPSSSVDYILKGLDKVAVAWETKYTESPFCECELPILIPVNDGAPLCHRCGKQEKVQV